jgi:hypothetical protein
MSVTNHPAYPDVVVTESSHVGRFVVLLATAREGCPASLRPQGLDLDLFEARQRRCGPQRGSDRERQPVGSLRQAIVELAETMWQIQVPTSLCSSSTLRWGADPQTLTGREIRSPT